MRGCCGKSDTFEGSLFCEKAHMNWIYFATSEKTSLSSTIETIVNANFLWRSAYKVSGALNANVRDLRAGDTIIIAWRHPAGIRTAYMQGTIATPLRPLAAGLVIDRIVGPDARALIAAGYPPNADGDLEGIRLDDVCECYFEVRGQYGGNNAIHKLAAEDEGLLTTATSIPPEAIQKPSALVLPRNLPGPPPPRPSAVLTSAVEDVQVQATVDNRAFDAYVMVDWSSSSSPVTGNDSIWIASGMWSDRTFIAAVPQNYPTRAKAVEYLQRQLLLWRREGKRVLVGLDFAFGYPAGFADKLGLTAKSGRAWRLLHEHFAARVTDSSLNEHNRDKFADECNRQVGPPGPFWGCTAGSVTPALTQHRVGVFQFPHHGLEEWRLTDIAAMGRVTTQSVWKLNCGVSVGGQTILGIKHLHDLASSVDGHRWPFEGWGTPNQPAIWFAEIFPSLVQYPEWREEYRTRRDRTQVQSCIRMAAERDSAGLLKGDFAKPATLDAVMSAKVEEEEGWILWVY
jgi:hypothetical protein